MPVRMEAFQRLGEHLRLPAVAGQLQSLVGERTPPRPAPENAR
jgi:hypothetical protein